MSVVWHTGGDWSLQVIDKFPGCTHLAQDPTNKYMIFLYFKDENSKTNAMRLLHQRSVVHGMTHCPVAICPVRLSNASAFPVCCVLADSPDGVQRSNQYNGAHRPMGASSRRTD